MFRPCWVILREKLAVVVTLGCTIQLNENVLLTVHCTINSTFSARTWNTLNLPIYVYIHIGRSYPQHLTDDTSRPMTFVSHLITHLHYGHFTSTHV
jgi:hypothetical protein